MSAVVRVFSTEGVVTAPVQSGGSLSYDSIQLMKMPYLGRSLLTVDTNTPQATDPAMASNRETKLIFVQVDAGKSVYYELTPAGQTVRNADNGSPVLRGDNMLTFGPNWVISVLAVN